jgi:peptidoglycan/LPS O-acetylase OafA/YrhL
MLPSNHTEAKNRRLPALDGLRATACLNVMLFHFLAVFFPAAVLDGVSIQATRLERLWYGSPFWFLTDGEFAVAVFFALSGFVLTADLFARLDNHAVLSRRATGRIVRLGIPAGASSIIACTLILGGAYQVAPVMRIRGAPAGFDPSRMFVFAHPFRVLLDNLLWSTWFGKPDVMHMFNPVLWTMSIEFQGSLLAFLCVLLFGRLRMRAVFIMTLVVGLVCLLGIRGVYLATMLSGTALASLRRRGLPPFGAPILAILGCLLGSDAFTPAFQPPAADWHCLGSVLLLWGVLQSPALSRLFVRPPLSFLGRQSFSLYLLHQPVLYMVGCSLFLWIRPMGGGALATVTAFVGFAVASLSVAWVFERSVDRPAIAFARNFGRSVQEGSLRFWRALRPSL